MQAIFEIDNQRKTPKYLQIAHSVTKAIRQGKIKRGDRILSINELSNEFFLSRDTVQKAYDMLEKDNIIQAVRGKGFYINRTDIHVSYRVLLVFNKLSSYKKLIYDGFIQIMQNKGTVDLKIHHSNAKVFEQIIDTSLGEYDYYIVMPHFYDGEDSVIDSLKKIPPEKLILMDKIVENKFCDTNAVYQDFENDITAALETGIDCLKKYNTLIYTDPVLIPKPVEIVKGFRRFCNQHRFAYKVIPEIKTTHDIQKGEAYVVIEDSDLINLIKAAQQNGFILGKDIGILSYNETPLKEVLANGISTISTDHYQMGKLAAGIILEQKKTRIKNQFTFIQRSSL